LEELYDAEGDGIKRTQLAPGELLVEVRLPAGARAFRSAYRKLRIRPSFDFPELGVAAALRFEDGKVATARLAVGGLDTYPKRFDATAASLVGHPLTEARAREVGEAVRNLVRPVRNTSLAPDYRKRMASVYVRRTLLAAAERGSAG
jgi:CO/xanthine dehydrogenase FAD-binding subunit